MKFAKVSPTRGRGARRAGERDPDRRRRPARGRSRRSARRAPPRRPAMPDGRGAHVAGARARRARIPYWLIAAVFVPLAAAYALAAAHVEGFRFAHPWRAGADPARGGAGAVGWASGGARAARRLFSTRAPRELGAQRRGARRAPARSADGAAAGGGGAGGRGAGAPAEHARRRRPRGRGHRHRHRARRVGVDAGDGPGPQPPRGGQGGDPGLRAPPPDRSHRPGRLRRARPTPTCR